MTRGNIVTVAAPGDYGKPRPAVVVQNDRLASAESVIVCLITSYLSESPALRLTLEPSAATGLRVRSEVMVEKLVTLMRGRIGPVIGRLSAGELDELDRRLAFVIGLE